MFVIELEEHQDVAGSPVRKVALTGIEREAVQLAGERFFEGLEAAPTQEASDPEYEAWWDASKIRSEEFLKAMLGWSRFNALTGEAARLQYEKLRQ